MLFTPVRGACRGIDDYNIIFLAIRDKHFARKVKTRRTAAYIIINSLKTLVLFIYLSGSVLPPTCCLPRNTRAAV